jgi:hypothetical protein
MHTPATTLDDDRSWAHLDTLKVGRYGEYFAKMALVRAGFDVYAPEVDDRAIDLILRLDGSPPRYFDVQVKTLRTAKPTYLFLRKKHFALAPNRYLALVLLREGAEPDLFLVPANVWLDPAPPFSSRDYEGLKSEPEYGLTVSPEALRTLERYRFRGAAFARSLANPGTPTNTMGD